MAQPKLSRLELRVMEALWEQGPVSIREVQERLSARKPLAYTTVQTIVYRLEEKGAVQRTRKIGNAHVFEAVLSRSEARGRLLDEVLGLFGGRPQPLISQLIESGHLTLEDIEEARRTLKALKAPEQNRKE
jgi:BlaI family transcriptional regulator, penicillinase repressor